MTLYVWESSLNSSNVIRFALKHESPSWCSKKGSLTTRSLENYAVLVPPGTEGTGNQYQYQKPLFRGTEIMFERYEEKRKLSSQKPDRLFLLPAGKSPRPKGRGYRSLGFGRRRL